jgi:phage tail-like protein
MAETGKREDPYRAYNFLVEIGGQTVGGFSEVSGLSGDSEVIEYREGADTALTARKLHGLHRSAALGFRRGVTTSRDLWLWRRNILNGIDDRRSGAITLLDEQRKPVMEWRFENGWPSKYEASGLNARNNEVFVETLEIAHEGLTIA